MDNKVLNKQIPIKTIVDIANYFEEYKERYSDLFQKDQEKNEKLNFADKNYEYRSADVSLMYTIRLRNGKNMKESNYNWFIVQLGQPSIIEEVIIDLRISYFGKIEKDNTNDQYNSINVSVDFRNAGMNLNFSDVYVEANSTNQERAANNIYYTVINILENNKDRFDKTIKNRKIRIQSFCIAVGIILSYIVYFILKINVNKLPIDINQYLTNKYIIIFGQWFLAILLGNISSYWYIVSIYKPLLPETKYTKYNYSTSKAVYTDDVDDYTNHCEVHFGKFWDAEKRRNKIEKIFKITRIIVLIQLLISTILFFLLK